MVLYGEKHCKAGAYHYFCLSNMVFNVVAAVCYADVGIRKMLDTFVFAAHINFQLREPVQCAQDLKQRTVSIQKFTCIHIDIKLVSHITPAIF